MSRATLCGNREISAVGHPVAIIVDLLHTTLYPEGMLARARPQMNQIPANLDTLVILLPNNKLTRLLYGTFERVYGQPPCHAQIFFGKPAHEAAVCLTARRVPDPVRFP